VMLRTKRVILKEFYGGTRSDVQPNKRRALNGRTLRVPAPPFSSERRASVKTERTKLVRQRPRVVVFINGIVVVVF